MEQEKLTNQKDTLAYLSSKYPKCFFLEGPVKPLKIGIFQDLAEELAELDIVSKRLLRISLRHYTSSWRYLACMKEGAARVNLLGEAGDLIEKEHAEHALLQLKESKAKAASNRESKKREAKINKEGHPGSKNAKVKSGKPTKHAGYSSKNNKDRTSANPTAENRHKRHGSSTNRHAKNQTSDLTKNQQKKHQTKPVSKLSVLTPIEDNDLAIGKTALVILGKDPMPVTINDIAKDGIAVQLKSGMTVKVKREQLFSKKA